MEIQLDRNKSEPIYRQISRSICRQVSKGQLTYEDKVPSEAELARKLNISRLTVTHCYKTLRKKGILVSHRGKGTFIAKGAKDRIEVDEPVERLRTKNVAFVVGAAWEDIPVSMANMVLDYMHGAANRLHRMEWDLCFFPLEVDTRMDITTPEIERLANFGGVIFEGETISCVRAIEFCLRKKIPAVALLPPVHLLRLPVMKFLPLITVDYSRLEAGRKAAMYLMNCGFKSIGFIGEITGGDSKYMGFISGLSERNVSLDSRHIIEFSSLQNTEGNCGKLTPLLEARNLPEAFFVDTDCKAMSVIDFLTTRGLRVPDDVSVLGYDDISGAGDFRVPLTTVRIPRREIAAQAVETLFSLKKTPENRIVPVEFSIIERSSVHPIVPPAGA